MPVFYADPNPIFQPAMRLVSAITNAFPAAVTTTFDHDYITGTIVRLYVPQSYGMHQANKLHGSIEVTGSTTFTIDIDTRLFQPFAVPMGSIQETSMSVPIGEVNETLLAAVQNVLPFP
jgi:hypothetical protein